MKAILTYHSIDASGSVLSVHPERFREHVEVLARLDVPVLTLAELCEPGRNEGIALTFDDGFQNFADAAWPILRDVGWPSTVFVATAWVGKENGWDAHDSRIPDLPLMDWSTLRELNREGVELGSHTRSHPRLTGLEPPELAREIEGASAELESETGRAPETFAYPYGDLNEKVVTAVEAAGHSLAVTTELRPLDRTEKSPLALPRLDAYYLAKPGVMEAWGTPRLRRYLTFRKAARRVRGTLGRLGRRA